MSKVYKPIQKQMYTWEYESYVLMTDELNRIQSLFKMTAHGGNFIDTYEKKSYHKLPIYLEDDWI